MQPTKPAWLPTPTRLAATTGPPLRRGFPSPPTFRSFAQVKRASRKFAQAAQSSLIPAPRYRVNIFPGLLGSASTSRFRPRTYRLLPVLQFLNNRLQLPAHFLEQLHPLFNIR